MLQTELMEVLLTMAELRDGLEAEAGRRLSVVVVGVLRALALEPPRTQRPAGHCVRAVPTATFLGDAKSPLGDAKSSLRTTRRCWTAPPAYCARASSLRAPPPPR